MNASKLEKEIVEFVKRVSDCNPNILANLSAFRNQADRLLTKIKQHATDNQHAAGCQCDRCKFYRGLQ